MSYGEIKKAVNSDLSKPLNTLIEEKTGAVNATGGTTTTGGIFAKLNKLLTDWTTARAGKIDNLDAAISTRASQTSITTLQNTINTINSNVVAPTMIMKNPRLVHLGASVNQSQFTVNLPLNVRVVRFVGEYNGNYSASVNNYSASGSCVINGVTIPLPFYRAANPVDNNTSSWGVVDKIFTAATNFIFQGSYTSDIPYNVYVLVCDI